MERTGLAVIIHTLQWRDLGLREAVLPRKEGDSQILSFESTSSRLTTILGCCLSLTYLLISFRCRNYILTFIDSAYFLFGAHL